MPSRWDIERSRAAWWVLGAALAAVLAHVLSSYLGTFVFGVFIYYATRPVYRRIRRVVRPPSLAAMVSLLTLALPALLLLAYTVAVGVQEAAAFLENNPSIPQLDALVGQYLEVSSIVQDPEQLLESDSAREVLQRFAGEAQQYLGFIGNALLHLFIMITIAYYLLKDDRRLASWVRGHFADDRGVVVAYGRAVDRDFSNIFFGNILNAVLTAIIGAISYNLLDYVSPTAVGLPYPTLLGLLTGVASLIPVVGMKLVYFPVAIYITGVAATTASRLLWFPAVFVAVSFVVVDTIPDFVLRPYVSGRGLHLGTVMLAYIFGPLLWGWYGIFLGPMLLVLVVHFGRLVLPELLGGRQIEPDAMGPELATSTGGKAGPQNDSAPDAGATDDAGPPAADAGADDGPNVDEQSGDDAGDG